MSSSTSFCVLFSRSCCFGEDFIYSFYDTLRCLVTWRATCYWRSKGSSGANSISAFVTQFHGYRCAVVVVGPANTCRRSRLAAETSACRNHEEIPTIIGNRCQSAITGQLFHGHRDVRVSALQRVQRCNPIIRVGLLNACSVSNKCANIQHWKTKRRRAGRD